MTFLDYSDWVTGATGNVVIAIGLNVPDIYRAHLGDAAARKSVITASASCSSSC